MESFKMESPVKKLDYGIADKENQPLSETVVAEDTNDVETKPTTVTEVKKNTKETTTTVSKVQDKHEDEPLLRENPNRFVLFPIKYHEVRVMSRRDA